MNRFPDNARVCFVGDSITHAGRYLKHIVAYYRKNFPRAKVEFYNCGIAGGNLRNTIAIYDEDIDIYSPTHIVLMIGVNDSRRDRLSYESSDEKYEKIFEAYERYKKKIEEFYLLTKERGAELILCTPAPYDEYQKVDSPVLTGGYALMLGYADFIREFARKKGIALCDYHAAMTRAMQREVLYSSDRVHPNDRGHFYMAKAFLASQGFELSDGEEIPADIERWYDLTQKIRDVVTAEFFASPDYLKMTAAERFDAVKSQVEKIDGGLVDFGDYVGGLFRRYLIERPRLAEYIEEAKCFMRS